MKKAIVPLYSIIFFTLSFTARSQAVENKQYEFVKERTISKSYPAKGNELAIDNKFGAVKVVTWNRNEIKVDIHIIASSTDEETSRKIFSGMDVPVDQTGNQISFTTKTAQIKDSIKVDNKTGQVKECKGCKSQLIINYEIHLPATTALTIKNSFGLIELPDYSGILSLESNHGSVKAGNLSKIKNISVFNGKAEFKGIKNSNCVFKWSSVEISKLSGDNLLLFNYCESNMIVNTVATGLTITGTYSTIHVQPAKIFEAEYLIDSRFGSFENNSNIIFSIVDEGNKANKGNKKADDRIKKYHGKSGKGTSKVLITSSYGDIIIGDRTAKNRPE